MEQMPIIEKLIKFGLTRQESLLYLTLYKEKCLTGYEASKLTGISRSNTYGGLAGLVDKGAAYIMEGAVTKYVPVPLDEFCDNKIRELLKEKEFLQKHIPKGRELSEGYITIEGRRHIFDKMKNMLEQAEHRVYISVSEKLLPFVQPEIEQLLKDSKKVVIITNKAPALDGAIVYLTEDKGEQIRLIIDSKTVLTGELSEIENTCLYSGQKNFVNVFKEAMSNEIKLIARKRGD